MKLRNISEAIARAQAAHPWRIVLGVLVISIVGAAFATTLTLDSSYQALLPEDHPQVRNANDIQARTGGTRQLVVAIRSDDRQARLEFGRRLVERLREVDGVRTADFEFPVDFFRERGIWLLETDALRELTEAAELAVQRYKTRSDRLALGLLFGRVQDEFEGRWENLPYDGVMSSRDGQYSFLFVTPSISLTDLRAGRDLYERIQQTTSSLDPAAANVEINYAGTLRLYQEQQQAISADLRNASIVAFILGVLIVAAFTRRPLAPAIVGTSLVMGIIWTYAITRLFIDRVNIVTGFLVAVLVGLGIDFGIHLYVRFQQEFSNAKGKVEEALTRTIVGTLPPALTSALTTAGTFFTFGIAEFPGIYEFGLVAGTGVVMTLLSTFIVLPPLLVVSARGWKYKSSSPKSLSKRHDNVTLPRSIVRGMAVGVVVAFAALAVNSALNLQYVLFRNDFKVLRGDSPAMEFTEYVDRNLGAGFNPAVFLVPSIEEAGRLVDMANEAAAEQIPERERPQIGRALSVADLLPQDIEQRQELIERLQRLLDDESLQRAELQNEGGRERLEEARRMVSTSPWSVEDLPEPFRRRFVTPDQNEYLVFVWPTIRVDADYQAFIWEESLDALNERARSEGISFSMVDESLIVAWISRMVLSEGSYILPLAALVVFICLLIDFRSFKKALLVAFPLGVGMLCFVGLLTTFQQEINMFNMVVLLSVVGIGIDAVVHIYHRYLAEGRGSLLFVLRYTGVAVFLASLTTMIGFASSLVCNHNGLHSLGVMAIIGIGMTFASAVFFFPAILSLLEGRDRPETP